MNADFLRNVISNVVAVLAAMAISFWLTPRIVNSLGAAAYGFIPLSSQMINYLTIVTLALTSMVTRFFIVAMKAGRVTDGYEYFNTLFFALLGLSVLLIPFIAGFAAAIRLFINVPEALLGDVRTTFLLFGGVFLISNFASSFNLASFYANKIYLNSGIRMVVMLCDAVFLLCAFSLFTPRIWFVSVSALTTAFIGMTLTVYTFTRLLPEVRISPRFFNRQKLRELLAAGVWNSINWVGTILFLQIDLLVANHTVGPRLAGEYAVCLQLSALLRSFAGCVNSAFGPTIMMLYAAGDTAGLVRYTNKSVRLTGFLMALPIGLFSGMGGTLLGLWINPGFAHYQWLLVVLTLHLTVNLAIQSLFTVHTAVNRVRVPALVTVALGAANFVLAYLLSGPLGWGVYGIAMAGLLVLTGKNLLFTPLYTARITGQPLLTYYAGVLAPALASLAIAGAGYLLQHYLRLQHLWSFLLLCCGMGGVYLLVLYACCIDREDRRKINAAVSGFFVFRQPSQA